MPHLTKWLAGLPLLMVATADATLTNYWPVNEASGTPATTANTAGIRAAR
jgi:hypothetical protein